MNKLFSLILLGVLSSMVGKSQTLPVNYYANPTAHALSEDKDTLQIGEKMNINFSVGNLGADPIPATGGIWILTINKLVRVDTSTLNLDGGDSLFTVEWFWNPDSVAYLRLITTGAGLPDSSGTNGKFMYNMSVEVEGREEGGPLSNVLNANFNAQVSQNRNPWDDNLFSDFVVVTGNINQPLQFISIDADWNESEKALIKWVVANERDNVGFEVERSIDLVSFETVGKVPSVGDHTTEHTYSLIDDGYYPLDLPHNKFYYRVKQIDIDGKETYSEIVKLVRSSQKGYMGEINLYPNPALDYLNLDCYIEDEQEVKKTVTIRSQLGQIVSVQNLILYKGANSNKLDLSSYTPGVYTITLSSGSINDDITLKFIKK